MIHSTIRRTLVGLLLVLLLCGCAAGARPARIDSVSASVQPFVMKEIAGAVTLLATRDGVVHLDAVGWADIAAQKPMRSDSIFAIASMSKPVAATAIMMLRDEGKLSLNDPVGKHVPELASLKTADGRPVAVTIWHLLTHTGGLAENTEEQLRHSSTLAELIPHFASKPVQFEPGSRWQYSQSGINTLGRIVEIVSGQSLPEFLQARLFGPLGMKDTGFYLSEEQAGRLARSYRLTDGRLEPAENYGLRGHAPTSRRRCPAPNANLFSSAPDYARFCRMILNQGSLDGRRYLTPESVKLMTSLQTGELKTGFTEGNGWGLGWCVVKQPQGPTAVLSPGSFGHGGAHGTQAWIDPVKGVVYILMVQRANFPNADASEVRRAFQQAAAAALGL